MQNALSYDVSKILAHAQTQEFYCPEFSSVLVHVLCERCGVEPAGGEHVLASVLGNSVLALNRAGEIRDARCLCTLSTPTEHLARIGLSLMSARPPYPPVPR